MTYYVRNLPHWQPSGVDIFITWRLHGSLPARRCPKAKTLGNGGKAFVRFDRVLDQAQSGPLWLKDPRIAETIITALHVSEQRKILTLRAYVLMANHVHVLLTPQAAIHEITRQIKGATARQANLILRHSGAPFWQDESFDHWIRTPGEWQKIRTYIEQNPVAAGLVEKPEDWPWSSASRPVQ